MSDPARTPELEERPGELVGTVVDGFTVVELLGRGGMGEVYKAIDAALERPVALKILNAVRAGDEEFARRFEREARAASAINHPNVAQIYGTGRWQGRPYIVMELVEGPSLAAVLGAHGRLTGLRSLGFLAQAAEGLRAAQEHGVVHRDVKPGNLVLDDRGRLKLVDFGLARRLSGDDTLTRSDAVIGTPRYMSPEQALAGPADHRADIYGLGATFYHLLAGEPPFDAATPVALMMKHVHEPLPPLQERNPMVPRSVCAIIERMLAKRPEDRYQSYDELLADIALVQAGRPLPAGGEASRACDDRAVVRRAAVSRAVVGVAVVVMVLATIVIVAQGRRGARAAAPSLGVPVARPAPIGEPARSAKPARPFDFSPASMIEMALRAKTLAHMRQLATALQVWTAERDELPAAVAEVVVVYDLDPAVKADGWGRAITYERLDGFRFRLSSAGADALPGTDDDVIIENGRIVKGEPEIPERFLQRR